jgi:hypothetical protein
MLQMAETLTKRRLEYAVVWVGNDIHTAEIRHDDIPTNAKALALRRRLKKQGFDAHYLTRRENTDRLNGKWPS